MRGGFRSHLTFANVASALALFMAIGGGGAVAVGAIGGSDGTIKACYVKKGNPHKGTSTGEVQLILKGSKCDEGEKAFSFNARGGQGPAGAPGAQGTPGTNGANGANGANGTARAYGSVSGAGVIDTSQSSPGVTALRASEGHYCVTVPGLPFDHHLPIVPVVDRDDGDSAAGDTAAEIDSGCSGFGVATFDKAGTQDDAGFVFVIP